ncbi:uncharacterized protein ISCGN_024536, partial [Ixodes scapularis]
DYLRSLNDFRTNLPRRLGHVEPTESEVKSQVGQVTTDYQNLLNRVNRLGDRFSGLGDRKRNYHDSVERATTWLNEAQRNAKRLLEEPTAAEPKAIQDQLDRVRAFNLEAVGQGRLIETAKHAAQSLLSSLEGASAAERKQIEETVKNLEEVYQQMLGLIGDKSNELQTALVHSQDIQDGLDRVLRWLDDVESSLRNQSKPASLIRERLDEQIHEHRVLQSEIDSHRPAIDAINSSARELLSSSNARLAKKVESKLKDVNSRFEKLHEKSVRRGELLDEVSSCLDMFLTMTGRFDEWFASVLQSVEGPEATRASSEEQITRLEHAMNQRNSRKDEFEDLLRAGKALCAKRDVTDTTHIRDKLKQLEQQWKELGDLLAEQQRQGRARSEQHSAYESLRLKVLDWLNHMEVRVDGLDAVAVDREVLRRQASEVKPLVKEHADYASTIDRVNDLGRTYDALLHHGESPRRGPASRGPASSPTKKIPASPTRGVKGTPSSTTSSSEYYANGTTTGAAAEVQGSPDSAGGKAAPSVLQSPLSSASSGFSSRHSSVDQFGGLDADLSPVQQQLSEINHRYHLIGVKLSDRQQEMESLAEELKRFQDNLKALLAFVQTKERSLPKESLPATKELAEKQLTVLKELQSDLQEKQIEVDRLRVQVQELLRRKPNAPGSESLQQQLTELLSRWQELLQAIRIRLLLIQEFKDFQDTHDLLHNWLSQKDKMFQVLGPIAHEPRMVAAQTQQVLVMRDEFSSQEPLLRRMNLCGQEVVGQLEPNNPAGRKIRDQMEAIKRHWNEMIGRLEERERSLGAATGATTDFHTVLGKLLEALQNIGDDFDQLAEAGDLEEQLRRLRGLDDRLEAQRPPLAESEAMCDHLCDILTDAASRNEIKGKWGTADKLYNNLNRKISECPRPGLAFLR